MFSQSQGKVAEDLAKEDRITTGNSDNMNPICKVQLELRKEKFDQGNKEAVGFDTEDLGCIEIELFANLVPRTVNKWFKMVDKDLATKLVFKNLVKGNFIETVKKSDGENPVTDQYTDLWKANENWLNGENENNTIKHKDIGYVYFYSEDSMCNGKEIGITLNPIPWYDGTNVVFGYVCKGIEVLEGLNKRLLDGTQETFKTLLKEVAIKSCEIIKGKDFEFDLSEDAAPEDSS